MRVCGAPWDPEAPTALPSHMNADDVYPGNYVTRDGHHACIWNAAVMHERPVWKGTIRGVGLQVWELDGRDSWEDSPLDLVARDAGQR